MTNPELRFDYAEPHVRRGGPEVRKLEEPLSIRRVGRVLLQAHVHLSRSPMSREEIITCEQRDG